MHRLNCLLLVGMAAVCLAISGCGPSTMGVEYVEGVVTLDGEKISEATVMFTPVTEGQGVSATGVTDENGVYKLTAASTGGEKAMPQAGTLPGEYYVGVEKTVQEEPMSEEEAYDKKIPYKAPAPGQAPELTYVIPQKYNNPKESGIRVTVKKGENDIPIVLTK